jgi:hypothetical protein
MAGLIRGPFGRSGDGKKPECAIRCNDCCGSEFSDMPDIIWIQMTTLPALSPASIIYFPLYKIHATPSNYLCECTEYQGTSIAYQSLLVNFADHDPCVDTESCCITWRLIGSCSGDACTWSIHYMNPMKAADDPADGEQVITMPVDETPGPCAIGGGGLDNAIMCGGLEGCLSTTYHHSGNPCVSATLPPTVRSLVIISKTQPGGTLATECCKYCCGMPMTIYVTISVPEIEVNGVMVQPCEKLHGAVVTLEYAQTLASTAAVGANNPNGAHLIQWTGMLNDCLCCPIRVSVQNNTWSYPDPRCSWTLRIGPSSPDPECYLDTIYQDGTSYCPPDLIFEGNLDGSGDCGICCGGQNIDFTAEIDF